MKKTTFILCLLLICAGCGNKPDAGIPNLEVSSGQVPLEMIGRECGENGAFFVVSGFSMCMGTGIEKRYLPNGETIEFAFGDREPDKWTLTEHILKEGGEPKYTTETEGKDITLILKDGRGSFVIEPNLRTALSSNSKDYLPGNTLKGYRLLCSFGPDEFEYTFIIRGDALFRMVVEE
ncbi:MAG: hypothetical protein LBR72_00805 [Oscillospiraceae bacterium]|nr:hypothetical protein [Oscillospiraceae bacterium]